MDNNIVLTKEEYMELVKLKARVEVVADIVANNSYVSIAEICTVLGIKEGKKDA